MAFNAASHNVLGIKTSPVSGEPPPASSETTAALLGASKNDPTGQHEGGKDQGDKEGEKKAKSEKELGKERKKAEKQKKFDEKKSKTANAPGSASTSKTKEKKAKSEKETETALPDFEWTSGDGSKKELPSFDDPLYKAYNPKAVESGWYSWWEKSGFFEPEFGPDGKVKTKGYFTIPEPPPNVTGNLHMGHALANALQDTLIRWNRMRGLTTLWLPGYDHAGISTQSVVEKMIMRTESKTRHDLGRPELLKRIYNWVDEYHGNINNALKRQGGSLDWTRESFTMGPTFSAAVTETFCKLHEEGYIYRSNRLINWCTHLRTSLSNLEVDNVAIEKPTKLDVPGYSKKIEFGVLTHFRYPIEGSDQEIEVATTRPETMLGDTGIAINPNDKRYTHLLGRFAIHPFLKRELPIFADEYVDMEFGTGAVKITPAHDPNDFEMGKKHGLDFINILNDDGTMNHHTGDWEGTKRFDARYTVIEALKAKGLYVKQEPNPMSIPTCQKSKDVIEPVMKPQWWMRMKGGLAEPAITAVKDGKIKLRPEKSEKEYLRWMENINDWCLSRQLWWGHQPPAYFVNIEGEPVDDADGERWIAARSTEAAEERARAKYPGKKFTLTRDPDVLDTWFSSGLWPFVTLGWPQKTPELEKLYPASILETGWDILFFWVARMIIFGIKMTGDIPFKEVYCHSLIRDSEGRKMSKSLGNVIDPLDFMSGISLEGLHEKLKKGNLDPKELERATKYQKTAFPKGIPECGADAMRFSLVNYTTGGGDILFDVNQMHGYRKFCNKIYQATKFVLGKLDQSFIPLPHPIKTGNESLAELWILHKLNAASTEINAALTVRDFSQATKTSYEYWYNHLCDIYIENSKAIIQDGNSSERESAKQTLYTALDAGLTLIHPFMPFLTEELWQRLPRRPHDPTPSICKAAYPEPNPELADPAAEEAYELVLGASKAIRSLAAEYEIKEHANVYIQLFDPRSLDIAREQEPAIKALGSKAMAGPHASLSFLAAHESKPSGCVAQTISASAAAYLSVKGRLDVEREIEKAKERLGRANEGVKKQKRVLEGLEGVGKVGWVLENERRKGEDGRAEVKVLEGVLGELEALKLE
ncbi:hypothetical protein MMC21_000515 [Puttea exsequens]|nr:hypothetical protein [Puttea exsequens]